MNNVTNRASDSARHFATMKLAAILCFFTVVPGSASSAPVPREKKPNDQEAIQGTWEVVDVDFGNRLNGRGRVKVGMRWTFEVDKFSIRHPGAEISNTADFKIDSNEFPKQIDWTYGNGGSVIKGVFELEGDDLKICYSIRERPMEFKAGNGAYLFTYRRVANE